MNTCEIFIPENVRFILDTLASHGYKAYIVGGCVRDSLRGIAPHDYDVAASALPDEIISCFRSNQIIKTGIKHGTVAVVSGGESVEITTFRTDGLYSDGRHPDAVLFTESAERDLSRRDFTVNAMAYSPVYGLLDPFGGRADLERKIIRCVGEPDARFSEDGLRIMRALRFSSKLGFSIDGETLSSLRRLKYKLRNISAERIYTELVGLVTGEDCENALRLCPDVLAVFIPEIAAAVGFEQRNPHHIYDVWEHTVRVAGYVQRDKITRLAALFHDLGKTECMTIDQGEIAHFRGHARISAEIADKTLLALKADNSTRRAVVRLVAAHDDHTDGSYIQVRRYVAAHGLDFTRTLINFAEADTRAKSPLCEGGLEICARCREICDSLEAQKACVSIPMLALNGRDLIEAGIKPGPAIKRTLQELLTAVTEGETENTKDALLKYIKK